MRKAVKVSLKLNDSRKARCLNPNIVVAMGRVSLLTLWGEQEERSSLTRNKGSRRRGNPKSNLGEICSEERTLSRPIIYVDRNCRAFVGHSIAGFRAIIEV